jgi:uncharacterized protein YbjT (DUF2867 family)
MKTRDIKSILVLGATGFVGRPLTESLVSNGYPVKCLVRDSERARGSLPDEVNLMEGKGSYTLADWAKKTRPVPPI